MTTHLRGLKFFVGQLDNDGYVAISKTEPYFCVHSDSEEGAVQLAIKALSFYISFKNKNTTYTTTRAIVKERLNYSQTPFEQSKQFFVPHQIISAEAC